MASIRWLSVLAIFVAAPCVVAQDAPRAPQADFPVSGKISGVVSGSDIVVAGKSIHLEGTRAPRRGRICLRNGESVDIGSEVADAFARKVVGSEATLSVHADESGRLVGRGAVNGEDIGATAIANGFAVTKIGDYSYAAHEREARNNRPGLWSCGSFPKAESAPETATAVPAPRPLPEPMDIKPAPSAKSPNAVDYLPPDAPTPPDAPPPPNAQEDDFELALDDVGGFFESIFSGIDRTIRDAFGAPPPSPMR